MKQAFKVVLFTFILSFIFSSCNRPDKKLPSKDGKWNYSSVSQLSGSASVTSTGTYTFTSDGKVVDTSGGTSDTYNWSYDKSGKTITLSDGTFSFKFEVKEAKAKSEKWHYTESNITIDVTLTR